MSSSVALWHEARFQLSRTSVRILLLLALVLSASAVLLGMAEVRHQRALRGRTEEAGAGALAHCRLRADSLAECRGG